jgi:hypothetical protein
MQHTVVDDPTRWPFSGFSHERDRHFMSDASSALPRSARLLCTRHLIVAVGVDFSVAAKLKLRGAAKETVHSTFKQHSTRATQKFPQTKI